MVQSKRDHLPGIGSSTHPPDISASFIRRVAGKAYCILSNKNQKLYVKPIKLIKINQYCEM